TSAKSVWRGLLYACRPLLSSGGRASRPAGRARRPSSIQASTTGQKGDVSGGSTHFQNGTASVQTALGAGRAGTPLAAVGCNSNLGKIGADAMSIGQVDGRSDGDAQVGRQVNRNVSGGSFED